MERRDPAGRREINAGTVYRRIPNWAGYFDQESGRPDVLAFMPRPQDAGGLSADLDETVARAELRNPRHNGFGLVSLDIEEIGLTTGQRASVWQTAASRSHVRIEGCDLLEVQAQLAQIAVVIVKPEPRKL